MCLVCATVVGERIEQGVHVENIIRVVKRIGRIPIADDVVSVADKRGAEISDANNVISIIVCNNRREDVILFVIESACCYPCPRDGAIGGDAVVYLSLVFRDWKSRNIHPNA